MKKNKQKIISFLAIILIGLVPLGVAAPFGTSEFATVETAKSWVGVKEVPHGNDRSGIDCSHLVYQVYKEVGAKNTAFQTVPNMKKNKYYVNMTSPKPGDVIFWKKNVDKDGKKYWLAYHVGIYIGNDQFIHASDETQNVTIDNITGIYNDGMPYYARWNANNEVLIKPERLYLTFWEGYTFCLITHKQTDDELLTSNPENTVVSVGYRKL